MNYSSIFIPKDLIALIDKAKYISFDIFDTAILRTIEKPEDLFTLTIEYYKKSYSNELSFEFRNARIESEEKAREQAWANYKTVEITIDDIYRCLCDNFQISYNVSNVLKQIEINIETEITVKNEFIYSIYRYCTDNDKFIIFMSDMYLPLPIIRRILKRCTYQDFKKIYLSSEYMMTKSNGCLYGLMLKEVKCKPNEILHIGDNYDSDIKRASQYGLMTYFYEKCINRAYRHEKLYKNVYSCNSIEESIYKSFIINKLYTSEDNKSNEETFWYRFGYKCAGILFYCFIVWLIKQAINDKIDRLFFLSRDGYIMKKVYDLLSRHFSNSPPSDYIYASRRALNIPSITKLDNQSMDFLISGTSHLSVEQFLSRVGIKSDNLKTDIKLAGFSNKNHKVITCEDYEKLKRLFTSISGDIIKIASEERQRLFEYFESIGILKYRRIGIVDIGWHGTLQYSLRKILEIHGYNPILKGYYLGTWEKAKEIQDKGIDMKAYVCELGQPQEYHDILKLCVEIFEFIHMAPHGSVVRFEKINGEIRPIFDNNDCDILKLKKAELLQQGALDFVKDFTRVLKFDFINIPVDLALKPIYGVLKNPSREEAFNLGDLEHAEGFGDVYAKRHIAKPIGFFESLFKPHKLIKGYKMAFWKQGYIKRLFFSNLLSIYNK